jgi:hypothetical protein
MRDGDKGAQWRRPLLEKQWDAIERASGLPPEARFTIEVHISAYLCEDEEIRSAIRPARIKGTLRKLRNQAKKLLKSFEEAICPDDVYCALVSPNVYFSCNPEQRKKLAEHRRIEKVSADLNALIDWLDQSERAVSRRGRSGPSVNKADNVSMFISAIDNALSSYMHRRLTRSDEQMMKEIFAKVDTDVGPGTINTAIRRVIDARKSRRA